MPWSPALRSGTGTTSVRHAIRQVRCSLMLVATRFSRILHLRQGRGSILTTYSLDEIRLSTAAQQRHRAECSLHPQCKNCFGKQKKLETNAGPSHKKKRV